METTVEELNLRPIGIFRGARAHPYEAPRQPEETDREEGRLLLHEGHNFEQALRGLEGADRIWVLFWFHHNPHWKPMVRPPRGRERKIGVFATRAPYRPNPVGLSCLRLLGIDGRELRVSGGDLLDGTPILDIKPYVTEADSFPNSKLAWLDEAREHAYIIVESETAREQLQWLEERGLTLLRGFLHRQLEYEPYNSDKKRVREEGDTWVLSYRTWRIRFHESAPGVIHINNIFSGYSAEELAQSDDPYGDKALHESAKRMTPYNRLWAQNARTRSQKPDE